MGEAEDVHTYTTDKNLSMGFSIQPLNGISLPPRSVVSVIK